MDFETNAGLQAPSDLQQFSAGDMPAAPGKQSLQPPVTRTIAPDASGHIVLPAGTDLDLIQVVGRNLVVTLPDGEKVLIPDGAILMPQLVIGDVEVPPLNLAALLIGEEPQPAAGPPQSSGGNFAAADGDIGNPFALGDLLPPTALAFTQPEEREILPIAPDEEPSVLITTPDQPAGATDATANVTEEALPARGNEPAGSNAASSNESVSGTIAFVANDSPAVVAIDGTAVTAIGQTFTTANGVLTITSIGAGTIGYSYTLTDNVVGPATPELFTVTVTDGDGDVATATLTIAIVDDSPTAINDVDSVAEDGSVLADGNVLTGTGGSDANTTDGVADVQGADGAHVTGIAFGGVAGTLGAPIQGSYGTLTLNADGSYSYALDNESSRVQGLNGTETRTETFTYTITDGDGDTSSATLVITVRGSDDPASVTGLDSTSSEQTLFESDLIDGSQPDAPALTQSGSFQLSALDGITTVTVGGQPIFTGNGFVPNVTIANAYGTLTVTGFTPTVDGDGQVTGGTVTYSYVLNDNTLLHVGANADSLTDSFVVAITDTDGSTDNASLDISIVDDVPTAHDDSAAQSAENAPISINVLTNDVPGADGVDPASGVALLDAPAKGSVTYQGGGVFLYTPAPGAEGQDSFTYTITDGDGDPSTATVTISLLADSTPTVRVTDLTVSEAALPAGTDPASDAETAGGAMTIATGGDTLARVEVQDGNGNWVDVTAATTAAPVIVAGAAGQLSVTSDGAGHYSYSYTLVANDPTHPDTNPNDGDGISGGADTLPGDSFAVRVTDSDGDVSPADSIDVTVQDDAPIAAPDSGAVIEGATLVVAADAGVLANDKAGADGFAPGVVGVAAGTDASNPVSGNVGNAIAGDHGTLTLNADGSYRYVATANAITADAQDVFVYTIRDADGDLATTTLTINLTNVVLNADNQTQTVYEAALDTIVADSDIAAGSVTGSDPDLKTETATGTISVVDAVGYTLVGSATGTYGVLSLNGTTGAYVYTLTTPFDTTPDANNGSQTEPGAEVFTYQATDAVGNTVLGTITIDIVDDVPTAHDDATRTLAEDAAAIDGNVLANDIQGADSATLTAVTIGGVTTAIAPAGTTVVSGAYGSYSFTAAGAWTFTPAPNLSNADGVNAGFSYVITDGDGDTSSALQPITVTDGAGPTAGEPVSLTLDDQNLPGGTSAGNPDFTSASISFTPGSDAIASILFGDTGGLGGGLTWLRVSGTQITGSDERGVVVTLDLSVTGNVATVTATLNDNYDTHPGINVDDLAALGTVGIIATDTDGDTATGTASVAVSDDLPVVTGTPPAANALTVDETVLATNAQADFSGLFTPDYRADGPSATTPIAYTLDVKAAGIASGLFDTATGSAILLRVNGAVVEGYLQSQPATLAFTLSVDAGGTVTLDQLRAVIHTPDSGPDQPAFLAGADLITLTATVTDVDGDTAHATVNIAGALRFEDDAPAITAASDPDANVLVTTQDADTIGAASDSDSANFSSAFSVATSSYGADGAGTTVWSYALGFAGSLVNGAPSGLSSNGVGINLFLDGGIIKGSTAASLGGVNAGNTIFSIAVGSGSGIVTLTQFAEIDHAAPGATGNYDSQLASLANDLVLLQGTVTITDKDGDSASATQAFDLGGNIRFADDGPVVGTPAITGGVTLDESNAVPSGFPISATSATPVVTASVSFGADGPGSVAYAITRAGNGTTTLQTAQGDFAISLVQTNATTITGVYDGGLTAFTVVINGNGTLTVTQMVALEHLQDGATPADFNDALTLAGLINATVTATDGDLDIASATAGIGGAIVFLDDGPSVSANAPVQLDDDALAGGNPGGTGDDPNAVNVTGTLQHDYRADGAGGIALLDTGAPGGFTYQSNGTVLTVKQGATTVLTITLTDATAGTYTVVQNAPIIHAAGLDENNQSFTIAYRVTDGDGDTVDGTLSISVDDDTPLAANDTDSVTEDGPTSANGNVLTGTGSDGNPAGADSLGADGPAVGGAVTGIAGGTIGVAHAGSYGSITLNADGSYSYALNNALPAVQQLDDGETLSDVFTYTISDRDGDTTTATLTITINGRNDAPVVGSGIAIVSEEGLASANADGSGTPTDTTNSASAGGTISIADVDGDSITVTLGDPGAVLTADGLPVTWTGVGTQTLVGSVGLVPVITVTITNGGAFTVTLSQSIDHPASNAEDLKNFTVPVNVSDGTANVATSIAVTIEDDSPIAVADDRTAGENGPALNGNVLTNDMVGADTPGAVVSINGSAIALGGSQTLITSFGTLQIFSDGSYSYTPKASVAAGTVDSFTYVMRDADGDTAMTTLKFTFAGDASKPTAGTATAAVDDDGLAGHNAASTSGDLDANAGDLDGPASSEASFTGILPHDFGLDGAGSISFAALDTQTATVGTDTVRYSWNGATNTLTATIVTVGGRGTDLFKVVVNPLTGQYTVTLLDNVLHAAGGAENDASVNLAYLVTDSDYNATTSPGSSATGTLTITFDDDMPSAFAPQSGAVANTDSPATPFNLNFANAVGADGLGDVVFSFTNGTAALDANGATLRLAGEQLFLFGTGTNVLTAMTADGDIGYTITINPGADTYVVDLHGTITNGSEISVSNLTSAAAGNSDYRGIGVNTTDAIDVLLSGRSADGTRGSVNTDSDSIGIDNQSMNPNEAARIDLVKGLTSNAGQPTGFAYTDHQEVASFEQVIAQVGGAPGNTASIKVTAINADNDQDFSYSSTSAEAGESFVAINKVVVTDASSGLVYTFTSSGTQAGFTVTFASGSASITGLAVNDSYEISGASPFDAVLVEALNGSNPFDLGVFSVVTINSGDPINLSYSVIGSDADSDSVTVNNAINLTLNPVTPPVAIDLDGNGLQFLSLSAGVQHDYGSGLVATAWVAPEDGLLAHQTGDGSYDIVFTDDAAGATTDLQGLALAYDSNGDGALTSSDTAFASFGVWQDANSNGVVDAGEFTSLTAAGIAAIALTSDGKSYVDASGDTVVLGTGSFTRADGTTGVIGDVVFTTTKIAANDDRATSSANSAANSALAGLNQALVAASLVATAAAAPAVLQAIAPDAHAATALAGDVPPWMAQAAPTFAPLAKADTPPAHDGLDRPEPAHGATKAPDIHHGFEDGARPASTDRVEPDHAPSGQAPAPADMHVDQHPLLAQGAPALSVDGAALMLAASIAGQAPQAQQATTPEQLAQTIAEALGRHDGPDLSALLDALPHGKDVAIAHLDAAGPAAGDSGHLAAMMGASHGFDMAMAAHDAMVAAHA
ncbi:beta strand repeat-containing protein [Sphingobium aquiterrae]|uniref:beta strand repeat-containing protein n=1 Tax=Sphingobium aquiterrae TaxID=2038656 RepID=UPI0030164F9C